MKIFGFDTSKLNPTRILPGGFGTPERNHRDWTIIVFTGLVTMTILIGVGVWVFFQVESGSFATPEKTGPENIEIITLDKEKLQEAVADLDSRQAKFEQSRNQPPSISNPAQ